LFSQFLVITRTALGISISVNTNLSVGIPFSQRSRYLLQVLFCTATDRAFIFIKKDAFAHAVYCVISSTSYIDISICYLFVLNRRGIKIDIIPCSCSPIRERTCGRGNSVCCCCLRICIFIITAAPYQKYKKSDYTQS
jgi:hypothetical protein